MHMHTLLRQLANGICRLRQDDSGQDLLEYGILTAIVGIAGLLVFASIKTKMGTSYTNWNTAAQDAWQPCPPKPAACS